jgi:2C-methyl-D-erythritol 2,4-cyclodiphosphate synthase
LARLLNAGTDASSVKAMTIEQLGALGKQNGIKFVVRGVLEQAQDTSPADQEIATRK